MLGRILEQLAGELGEQADIVKLNTDEQPALAQAQAQAQAFQIRSIPAVKLFHHGKVVAELVGVQPATRIREMLAPYLAPAADDQVRTLYARAHFVALAQLDPTASPDLAVRCARGGPDQMYCGFLSWSGPTTPISQPRAGAWRRCSTSPLRPRRAVARPRDGPDSCRSRDAPRTTAGSERSLPASCRCS